MNSLVAKYRALLALVLVAVVGVSGCKPSSAVSQSAIDNALEVAKSEKPDTRVHVLSHKFAATGDNPAGWKIDPTTGNLVAPSGKVLEGLSYKNSVAATAIVNQATLTGLAQTIDTIALSVDGTRVNLWNQTTTSEKGCWVVHSSAWTRCPDFAAGSSAFGSYFPSGGSANKGVYLVTAPAAGSDAVGTANLTAVNLSGGGGGLTSPLSANLDFGTTNKGVNIANATAAQDVPAFHQIGDAVVGNSSNSLFGDGSDGALSASSGTTTLTKNTHYSSITLTGTAKIDTAGFTIDCSGTTDLTGMPMGTIFRTTNPGGAGAAGGTAGTAGAIIGNTDGQTAGGAAFAGTAGGAGGTAAGSQATAPTNITFSAGGATATSGAGGLGSGGAGGVTRAGATATRTSGDALWTGVIARNGLMTLGGYVAATGSPHVLNGGAGGPGGGGGGGDGTAGGGGGGGGSGALGMWFATKTLIVTGASAGVIQVKGGLGGAGGSPAAGNRGGGGGGSGGGGGIAELIVGTLTGSLVGGLSCDGGDGGNGGNGIGTGVGGNGGGGGAGGHCVFVNMGANTIGVATGVGGSAGNAASGTTGGTGSVGEAVRVSL